MNNKDQQWDAIFVGAGITSLACAAILVKRYPGIKLLLIEKHLVPGGYASAFERQNANATFDCSLHKLSGVQHQGKLQRIFEYLDLNDSLDLVYPEDYFYGYFSDQSIQLPNSVERVERQLCQSFPDEHQGIQDFFQQVRTYGRNGYHEFQMQEGAFEPDTEQLRYAHKKLKNITVEEGLGQLFQESKLKQILAAPGMYVGGNPEDLSYLYFLHMIYATLNKGNAYIKGGSQNLSNTLVKQIEAAGSKVLLNTKVDQILVDDAQVTGVRTRRGSFHSDKVLINASPHYALNELFDEKLELEDIKEKFNSLKPARSTTTIFFTTDCPPESLGLKHSESMIFNSDLNESASLREQAESTGFDEAISEQAFWHASTMEVTNYHKLDPDGGYVVCLNVLDSIKHWPRRRTQPYRNKKQRAATVLIQRLIAHIPALEGHIKHIEISSPHTYVRFTNNTDGSGYGAMMSIEASGQIFHHRFPVKGVEFLSAWVAGPSYEAAFCYAQMKAKTWNGI